MKKISKLAILSIIISMFMTLSVSAKSESVIFNLADETTGYQIIFPSSSYELVNVKGNDIEIGEFEVNALLLDTPDYSEKVKEVLLFQVSSNNPEAHTLEVNLGSNFGGQTLYKYIEFVDGIASVYQTNSNSFGFKDYTLNDITNVYLTVYDQAGEVLYDFFDINFMYENYNNYPFTYLTNNKQKSEETTPKEEQKATEDKTTTNKPANQSNASAVPTSSKVLVGGKEVQFEAYNINDNNYFKLRDIAAAVNKTDKQFEVSWDAKNNAIGLLSKTAYTAVGGELTKSGKFTTTTAKPTNSALYIDGEKVDLIAYNINNNNYFKLRDIAKAFNIGIIWDGESNSVIIDTAIDYKE